jgi:transposase
VNLHGFLLAVHVHEANIQDRVGLKALFEESAHQELELKALVADYGYDGEPLSTWLMENKHIDMAIASPDKRLSQSVYHGFKPKEVRWVVERTFAWMSRRRRLARDYEASPRTTRAWMFLAMSSLVLKRLAS